MKFNIESPVFQFLSSLADFVALNLVFLLTCIPVFTIGPAVSALFFVTMREARGEHCYMVHSYLQAMKDNFKTGFLIFVFYFIIGAILLFNITFWLGVNSILSNVVLVILTLCAGIYLLSLFYVFALNARFENTVRQTIKNSVQLALSNRVQTALLLLIFIAAAALLCVIAAFRAFMLIFGFAFLAYCASFPLTKVFGRYEPEEP